MFLFFIRAFNDVDHLRIIEMFEKIHHRGPYLFGKYEHQNVLLAQNYLQGDLCFKIKGDFHADFIIMHSDM